MNKREEKNEEMEGQRDKKNCICKFWEEAIIEKKKKDWTESEEKIEKREESIMIITKTRTKIDESRDVNKRSGIRKYWSNIITIENDGLNGTK